MNLETAHTLALEKINETASEKMVISNVIEKPDGWIFYYDTEMAVTTGDRQKYGALGNVPLFIDKAGAVRYISNPADPLLQ